MKKLFGAIAAIIVALFIARGILVDTYECSKCHHWNYDPDIYTLEVFGIPMGTYFVCEDCGSMVVVENYDDLYGDNYETTCVDVNS